jgi:hypothetical protein
MLKYLGQNFRINISEGAKQYNALSYKHYMLKAAFRIVSA